MSILAAALVFRGEGSTAKRAITDGLERTAETLIRHMGLLFVPAGVGLIAEIAVLRSQWLPIVAGLIGSTLLSLAVTGLVAASGSGRFAAWEACLPSRSPKRVLVVKGRPPPTS
ncbi:putative effector of murein hydrolase LrgA (UPF0299 family) [Bradyrhizobium sp. GM6.1]